MVLNCSVFLQKNIYDILKFVQHDTKNIYFIKNIICSYLLYVTAGAAFILLWVASSAGRHIGMQNEVGSSIPSVRFFYDFLLEA